MRVRILNSAQMVAAGLEANPVVNDMVTAMRRDRTVHFIYDGKPRTVEVHAIGTSTKDGGLVMRGVQVAGGASRPLPQWTLFRLDRITGLSEDFTESQAPRDGYTMGDSQMSLIIAELDL
jgi:hypothetical protein